MKNTEQLFFIKIIQSFVSAVKIIEEADSHYTKYIDDKESHEIEQVGEIIDSQLNQVTLHFIEGMGYYDELVAGKTIRFSKELPMLSDALEVLEDFQHFTKKIKRNALDPEGKEDELVKAHQTFMDYYGELIEGERTFLRISVQYLDE